MSPPARPTVERPDIEATLRGLGGPVFGFTPQPHLSEVSATTETAGARIVGVSRSYTYYRLPLHPSHPRNFVDLTPEQTRAIEQAEASQLPAWMIEQVTRIRYPTLWDAIRTTKALPGDPKNALEIRLTAHANDVLRVADPHHVLVRPPRATRSGRISPADMLETTAVIINRQPHRGRLLDLRQPMVALGAHIGNRYLTVVYDSRIAPRVTLEFTTAHPAALPSPTLHREDTSRSAGRVLT